MRYEVRVAMRYEYGSPVPFAQHVLRVLPERGPAQAVRHELLTIEPEPAERRPRDDFFGNRTLMIAIDQPHAVFDVQLKAQVVLTPPPALPADGGPAWEQVRTRATGTRDFGARSPVHFLYPGESTGFDESIVAYTRRSFEPARPILSAALDLMRRIQHDFAYTPGATHVATRATEAMALRKGVCQDFSHVMIAGMRALGLPAAYVSGLLRTLPPPGRPRLEGADAMHAWVAVWAGAGIGWVELDPTNAIVVGTEHIRTGFGREYLDVAPIDGVIIASDDHVHTVGVDVIPVD